jgi:hypothetical protein
MPARNPTSTSNDAFSFHAGPVLVQPIMAESSLRIEALSPMWSYGIFLESLLPSLRSEKEKRCPMLAVRRSVEVSPI